MLKSREDGSFVDLPPVRRLTRLGQRSIARLKALTHVSASIRSDGERGEGGEAVGGEVELRERG